MQKDGVQTDGQKLLKQLREEYRRLEREDLQPIRAGSESDDSKPWVVAAPEFVN